MGSAVRLREDYSAAELRRLACGMMMICGSAGSGLVGHGVLRLAAAGSGRAWYVMGSDGAMDPRVKPRVRIF